MIISARPYPDIRDLSSRGNYFSAVSTNFYPLGRDALLSGLIALGLQKGDGVIVPAYMCDSTIKPLQAYGFNVVLIDIDEGLGLPIDKIRKVIKKGNSIKALLAVHYFGQPQNFEPYRALCDDNNLLLVEDNSHGHGGRFDGQLLGTFGDIGISSPRKILGLPHGGLLYCQHNSVLQTNKMKALPTFELGYFLKKLKTGLNYVPKIKGRIKGVYNIAKNWSDPHLFREKQNPDYRIDSYSQRRIVMTDWQNIAHHRRIAWTQWTKFVVDNGLMPVFSSVHPESCPWVLPVYAQNLSERNHWLKWGSKHGVDIFPWPTLPEEIINEDGSALARWKRLLCFSLDVSP